MDKEDLGFFLWLCVCVCVCSSLGAGHGGDGSGERRKEEQRLGLGVCMYMCRRKEVVEVGSSSSGSRAKMCVKKLRSDNRGLCSCTFPVGGGVAGLLAGFFTLCVYVFMCLYISMCPKN